MRMFTLRRLVLACGVFALFAIAGGGYYYYHVHAQPAAVAAAQYKTPQEASPYKNSKVKPC